MLTGTIFITSDINIALNSPIQTKILDMDEENRLPLAPHVIKATCLLPPLQAKMAEIDGDEVQYNHLYSYHLIDDYQCKFITAVIAFLYSGGNLLVYLPEDGYDNTLNKFCELMFREYGIHIGIIGSLDQRMSQCFYDFKYIPSWLNLLYKDSLISPIEYLVKYPIDAMLNDVEVMRKLVGELRPYGESLQEQINMIYTYRNRLLTNPQATLPISMVGG